MPEHEAIHEAAAVAGLVPKEIWLSKFEDGRTKLVNKYRLRYDRPPHDKLEFVFMDAPSFDQRWPNDEAHNGGRAGVTVFRDDWCERMSSAQFQSLMIHEVVNMRQGIAQHRAPEDFEATMTAARWAQSSRCIAKYDDRACRDAYMIQALEVRNDDLDVSAWETSVAQTQALLAPSNNR